MSALHIFDMDGTLLRGTSASIEIARHLDRVAAVLELDRRWVSREITPNFFADHLRERGLDVVCASGFPPLPFRAAVDPALILSPADKVHLVEAERVAHGLPRSACVAYGDSTSDVPLFETLENTIAVNADAVLETIARISYRGASLLEAYARGRSLLDAGAVTSP